MSRVEKIGIAGLGHIGRRHLAQYRALGLCVVTSDPRTDSAEAKSLGSSVHYSDFEEMLAKEKPEAVSICLPSFMHRDSAIKAFRQGTHVLMEKPIALSLQDTDDILTHADDSGCRIMVAHVCRFMGQNIMAKEIIESFRLGRPVYLNAWRDCSTPSWSDGNWMGSRRSSGGTVMDLQIHEIDLACWFLGHVREAALVQRQGSAHEGTGFFHVISNLSFKSGAAAVLEAGHLMADGYPFTNGYRLVFEGGTLEFHLRGKDATMHLYEKGSATDLTGQYKTTYSGRNPYLDEISHFVDCLNTGKEFIVTARDARNAVENALRLEAGEILPV